MVSTRRGTKIIKSGSANAMGVLRVLEVVLRLLEGVLRLL